MKRFVTLSTWIIACTLAVSLASGSAGASGRTSTADAKTYTLKIGNCCAPTFFQTIMAERFAKLVQTRTNGAVKVQLFNNGVLGTDQQVLSGLQLGTIQGYLSGASSGEGILPEVGLLALPLLIKSDAQMAKVLSGPVGQQLKAGFDKAGIHVLSWPFEGFRDLLNNGHPVVLPGDLTNMKIRTAATPVYVNTWKALGAEPTPLSFADVYLGLQQGTLDGADVTLASVVASKLNEVGKYVSLLHWQDTVGMLAVSKKWFDSLPKRYQVILGKAANQLIPVERTWEAASYHTALIQLERDGLDIVTPEIAQFRPLVSSVLKPYLAKWPKQIKAIRAAGVG